MIRFFKTLAVSLALGLSFTSHAADNDLYSYQPCPDSIASKDAQPSKNTWDLTLSPYTHHWHYNPTHKDVYMVGLERYIDKNKFCGLALFNNSFGQSSAYGYLGQRWDSVWGNPKIFTKITVGLIYGYKGEYKDKISFNQLGIAPAIVPSIGYLFTPQDYGQIVLLGTAAIMLSYGHSF